MQEKNRSSYLIKTVSSRLFWHQSIITAAQAAHRLGFEGFEIWTEHAWRGRSVRQLRSQLKKVPLRYYLHAPFYDLNLSSINSRVSRFSLSEVCRGIKLAAMLRVDQMAIHPGHCSSSKGSPETHWWIFLNALETLQRAARKRGIRLAIENMEARPKEILVRPSDFDRLFSQFSGNDIGLCLDLAHAATAGKDTADELASRFGERIFHVHLSNVDDQRVHLPLDQGRSPVTPGIKTFLHNTFSGPLTLEGAVELGERAAQVGLATINQLLHKGG